MNDNRSSRSQRNSRGNRNNDNNHDEGSSNWSNSNRSRNIQDMKKLEGDLLFLENKYQIDTSRMEKKKEEYTKMHKIDKQVFDYTK